MAHDGAAEIIVQMQLRTHLEMDTAAQKVLLKPCPQYRVIKT